MDYICLVDLFNSVSTPYALLQKFDSLANVPFFS